VPETVLDGDAALPQGVSKLQHRREIVAADGDQKGAELGRRLGCRAALLEEVTEDDISHAEPQGGKIEETVVAASTRDRAQRFLGVEQLEYDAGVVGESAHNGEVHRDEVTKPHGLERLHGLSEGLTGFSRGLDRLLTPERRDIEYDRCLPFPVSRLFQHLLQHVSWDALAPVDHGKGGG